MKIYLAGHVPKGNEEAKTFDNWRNLYASMVSKNLNADIIDPYDRENSFDESNFIAVFGLDCNLIRKSDLIIVNGEIQLGVGTSQEMVIAKYFNKPVITVLPKNSFHRRSNIKFRKTVVEDWIHPFIFAFSDIILDQASDLKKLTSAKIRSIRPKNISIIDNSIDFISEK